MRNEKGQFIKGFSPVSYWKGKKQPKELVEKRVLKLKGNKSRTGLKNSEDSNEKRRQWSIKNGFQTKELHPYYIVDRTKLKTDSEHQYDMRYKNWMSEVKNRDNWKCRIGDIDCNGKLEAHHILRWSEYPELRYDINNGITLCHFHHPRKRDKEEEMIPFFKEILL